MPEDCEFPKSDSTYSIDIPNSVILWQATPRPAQTGDVSIENLITKLSN